MAELAEEFVGRVKVTKIDYGICNGDSDGTLSGDEHSHADRLRWETTSGSHHRLPEQTGLWGPSEYVAAQVLITHEVS